MPIASATAHPNIALVKYWGKRDQELILPVNSSISMTLDSLASHTTVKILGAGNQNSLNLNGEEISVQSSLYREYIGSFLQVLSRSYGIHDALRIVSKNNFPTAAGLASSSSGFAALSCALNALYGLDLEPHALSRLARQGSGSATRSILGGFNFWLKGVAKDGSDSQIQQIADEFHWPDLALAIVVTSTTAKSHSSRSGMQKTVETCPIYQAAWVETVERDLQVVEEAIKNRSFSMLGVTAEQNALKMHATMLATTPPVNYWNETTKLLTGLIVELRQSGALESYYTIDAGPQVKILYQKQDREKIDRYFSNLSGVLQIHHVGVGSGAQVTEEHLIA